MTGAWGTCSTPGCTEATPPGRTRCPDCDQQAAARRDPATPRGRSSRKHRLFRAAVLARDPTCTVCQLAASTVADHYPLSRRELIEQGLDPNAPERGRGLCKRCHDAATASMPSHSNKPDLARSD